LNSNVATKTAKETITIELYLLKYQCVMKECEVLGIQQGKNYKFGARALIWMSMMLISKSSRNNTEL